jgi:hypothetical protein
LGARHIASNGAVLEGGLKRTVNMGGVHFQPHLPSCKRTAIEKAGAFSESIETVEKRVPATAWAT